MSLLSLILGPLSLQRACYAFNNNEKLSGVEQASSLAQVHKRGRLCYV